MQLQKLRKNGVPIFWIKLADSLRKLLLLPCIFNISDKLFPDFCAITPPRFVKAANDNILPFTMQREPPMVSVKQSGIPSHPRDTRKIRFLLFPIHPTIQCYHVCDCLKNSIVSFLFEGTDASYFCATSVWCLISYFVMNPLAPSFSFFFFFYSLS